MPQARTTAERETIDLIAPWYSQERLPADGKEYRTLQRRKKTEDDSLPTTTDDTAASTDDDDEFEWVETVETQRFKEHITLYRHVSHGDAKWVSKQANIFKGFNGAGNPKINEAQMARMRTLGYMRRIVEITNSTGAQQPHATEADFDAFDEPELQYLEQALKVLDDPVAPILHEDIAKAEDIATRVNDRAEQGFTGAEPVDVETVAATEARDSLFRPD